MPRRSRHDRIDFVKMCSCQSYSTTLQQAKIILQGYATEYNYSTVLFSVCLISGYFSTMAVLFTCHGPLRYHLKMICRVVSDIYQFCSKHIRTTRHYVGLRGGNPVKAPPLGTGASEIGPSQSGSLREDPKLFQRAGN